MHNLLLETVFMREIIVVAAIWQNEEGAFFLAQRGKQQSLAGYWEFPGGKVEFGEEEETALARELKEELGIEVEVESFCTEVRHLLKEGVELSLRAYHISNVKGVLSLAEHQDAAWVEVANLLSFNLSPADIPIAKLLIAAFEK